MISIIVAVSENNVIGKMGTIPWYLPRDLRNFKQLTVGGTCVMGRKTFESIIARLGKPLPERKSIVITRQENYVVPEGCIAVGSWKDAMKQGEGDEIFIIGGEGVYAEALPYADRILLTRVHTESDGEIKLPQIDFAQWKLVHEEVWEKDEKNEHSATYSMYKKIDP